MQKLLCGLAGLATAFAFAGSPALAQDTIKIGIIMPYSGQFADTGIQLDNGIKLYVKQHGDTVAGKKIEFIRKDVGGIAPDRRQAAGAGTDRARPRRHSRRLCADAERARGRRRLRRGQEVHGGDERRHLDHHHQVALHGPHVDDHAAAQPDARHLGGQERA